jgi:hypothetical protein
MRPTRPWTGTPTIISQCNSDEPIAIIPFRAAAHMFGLPNDEAFEGHPLASRGLEPYGAFRIEHSSWIRKLEKMNRVHYRHAPAAYSDLQHLVFAFHDSTFECICDGDGLDVRTAQGIIYSVIPSMVELLFEKRKQT